MRCKTRQNWKNIAVIFLLLENNDCLIDIEKELLENFC